MIESLSGQQIGKLVDALLGAYPSRDDLRIMVRIELDETLAAIADGANQRVVTFNLVTWAVRSGRIDDLLAGARRHNPGNRALAALVESLQVSASASAPAQHPRATPSPTGPAAIDVFLSYAREDSGAMREVEASLRAAGLAVWTDEGLEAGTPSWSAAIEEAVAQAAAMVVLLSPAAKASVWVENEVALAQRKQKRIFPILVSGDEDNAVPFRLISAQWVDGRQGLGLALLSVSPALLRYLGRESIARPAPPIPATPIPFDWVLIPAGEFLMGSDRERFPEANDDELPQHRVYLDAYYISRVPVTNEQYAAFVTATGYDPPFDGGYGYGWENGRPPEDKDDHPVVDVSWKDALAFCRWANVCLPTEAQWEKAARGVDGYVYPWGNDIPTNEHCSFDMNVSGATPVGAYPQGASPFGVLDMAGNVWEWVADWYGSDYYARSPQWNPTGPTDGEQRVLRGGSWFSDQLEVTVSRRKSNTPVAAYPVYGFRVAVCVTT